MTQYNNYAWRVKIYASLVIIIIANETIPEMIFSDQTSIKGNDCPESAYENIFFVRV